jgi:hypothetical protein
MFAADGTQRAYAPEHLALTQSQDGKCRSRDEGGGNENEVNQGYGESNQRGDQSASERQRRPLKTLLSAEDIQLGYGTRRRSSEASQGQLDGTNFHYAGVSGDGRT